MILFKGLSKAQTAMIYEMQRRNYEVRTYPGKYFPPNYSTLKETVEILMCSF